MKYKLGSSILALIASIIVSYAVSIEVFHTHLSYQHNCPVCHFQLTDSSDVQHTINFSTFAFIQFFEAVLFFKFPQITQHTTSRSPPTV
ncbi:MAG: hypothetical protein ACUVRK_05520 [Spirochaetota bacterium]